MLLWNDVILHKSLDSLAQLQHSGSQGDECAAAPAGYLYDAAAGGAATAGAADRGAGLLREL